MTALDLGAKGSLACWFSSLVLLAAFAAATLIYSLRKHRADDYDGRYRIWLWAAGGCLLAATDQAASLREALRDALAALGGARMIADSPLWLGGTYLVALGAIGARLVADMRGCRLSTAALMAAATAYAAAAADRFGWLGLSSGTGQTMFQFGSETAGNGLLLAAMAFHARWLILDAQSELACRADEEQPAVPHAAAVSAAEASVRVDPQHAGPEPICSRAAARPSPPASPPGGSPSPAIPSVARKLTKDERRALKARLLQQRQQREQRG
jgi:hypothetical protein